jgi:hypothetical protein
MVISADDVFAETMSPELTKASDRRTSELLREFGLREAQSLKDENTAEAPCNPHRVKAKKKQTSRRATAV